MWPSPSSKGARVMEGQAQRRATETHLMRTFLLTLPLLALSATALADDDHVELPAAVKATLDARWPGAQILESERDDGKYEVEIRTPSGERLEIELSRSGRVLEVENDDDDDDRR